jgi:subtilisin family serine protease
MRLIRLILISSLLVFALVLPAIAADPEIRLHSRHFTPEPTSDVLSELHQLAGQHALVQLHQVPNARLRSELKEQGITLLKPISGKTWLAAVATASVADAAAIRWVGELAPKDKLETSVAYRDFRPHSDLGNGRRALDVGIHRDVSREIGEQAIKANGGEILDYASLTNSFIVAIDPAKAEALAQIDAINWIGEASLALKSMMNVARPAVGGDTANEAPYFVTGAGISAFVLDGGSVADGASAHPDLAGRVTVAGAAIPDIIGHPTHVSCTIAGDGTASGGKYQGMAPEAHIISSSLIPSLSLPALYDKPGNMEAAYKTAIQEHGATVSNNSIGSNLATFGSIYCDKEGDYERTAQLVDEIVNEKFGRITIVWANGNERGNDDGACGNAYNTTAPPSTAKNSIAVGAVNKEDFTMTPFSSWGPTDDGRLRPDISAPGCALDDTAITSCAGPFSFGDYTGMCGTSMACPVVTGSVALLQEYWKETTGGDPAPASTNKALVIHGSDPVGSDGPDYQFGWGILNVPATLDLVDEAIVIEDQVDQGETFSVTLEATGEPIKVTLVWTDPAGEKLAEKVLVNDLDLTIETGKAIELPWLLDPANPADEATRGQDRINPVEQVEATAGDGLVEVVVAGFEVPQGPQKFSLVLTGLVEPGTGDDDDSGDDDDDTDTDPVDGDDDDDDDDGGCGC